MGKEERGAVRVPELVLEDHLRRIQRVIERKLENCGKDAALVRSAVGSPEKGVKRRKDN